MPTAEKRGTGEITQLLNKARGGEPEAVEQLMAAVYQDLRRLAGNIMSGETPGHTLQPTALVSEAFLRLFRPAGSGPEWRSAQVDWQSRSHFMAIAARQMRQVLVDHARQKKAAKRHGLKIQLEDAAAIAARPEFEFETIDQLLNLLATKDAAAAQVVELKFFGGLTDRETALVMKSSTAKVRRDWEFARSWLRCRIESAGKI